MSCFQITDSHFRKPDFPFFSTDRFLESDKFAACVPDLICQRGKKVMGCWTQVKYMIPIPFLLKKAREGSR